ncbi:MAG: 4-(cytidine 5'-diphospho)-2-C-methyl-D-erythritol kinase [Treponema sp.]|nr:4-(cytidine 5'-diphospho)-2-C-methyl-D-erythritol kinase [Treponema sp.]
MPLNTRELTVFAPAKINLHLDIKDKRDDGFHNIESVFLAVDFCDFLHFQFNLKDQDEDCIIELDKTDADFFDVPMKENIIYKAVTIFRRNTGFSDSVKIRLEKNIPSGGGLGGGSSDAAAALMALNEAAGFPLKREALLEMGSALGSDVPFFLYKIPAAVVTGRGEIINPVKLPLMNLTLVNPGFKSNTAEAFKLLDENRRSFKIIDETADCKPILQKLNVKPNGIRGKFNINNFSFLNSFLPVFNEREKSIYNEIISSLKHSGALFAGLSGSGSTCFGIFSDQKLAEKTNGLLSKKWCFVKTTKTYYM